MKLLTVVTLLFSLNAFAESVIVEDIHGGTFETTRQNIAKALVESSPAKYDKKFINDDGSITFIKPKFRYMGEHYRITKEYQNSVLGVCKFLGMDRFVDLDNYTPASKRRRGLFSVVSLDQDGRFYNTVVATSNSVIDAVTCM